MERIHNMEAHASAIRTKILEALRTGESSIPDRNVFAHGEVQDCLNMLREVTSLDVAFLDVPLESVVVVHHDNPAPADSVEKRTWRTIMSGITAERWGQAQLDYMESEIAEKDFGISDARGPLELYSIGGAVGSYNGLHRLAAAACWLSTKNDSDGGKAELRKAAVALRTFPASVHNLFAQASKGQWDVFVGKLDRTGLGDGPVVLKLVNSSKEELLCQIDRYGVTEAVKGQQAKGFFGKLFSSTLTAPAPLVDWKSVPRLLVKAIADNQWIKNSPRYEDRPVKITAAHLLASLPKKQFSGTWSETVFENDGTRVIGDDFFTESHGYNDADRRGIAALEVGETWQSDAYGDSHTVTRLPDIRPADEATDGVSEPSARPRVRP
jgi:hypothetical protein